MAVMSIEPEDHQNGFDIHKMSENYQGGIDIYKMSRRTARMAVTF